MYPMAEQKALKSLWLESVEGRLCGRAQAKAWALREVWIDDGRSPYGLYSFVAHKVRNMRGGNADGDHPTKAAMKELFEQIDRDPDWFPGKHNGDKRGPKRVWTGARRTAIVSAAKRLKREGNEPTYSAVVAACPVAALNPKTGERVHNNRDIQCAPRASLRR